MWLAGPWVPLVAAVIFLVFAYFTRAPWPRSSAALTGGLLFGLLNIACDLLGHKLHWWWYPAFGDRGYGAIEWYIAAALVPGAAFGLVGWRVHRRFGLRGLYIFLFAFAV